MIVLERMKKKAQLRPANLFFVELMCVLLFFSISAAIILQVFAAADNKQKLGSLTEKTMICAQSLAESYSVTGDLSETVKQVFGEETDSSVKVLTIALDSELKTTDEAVVTLKLSEISETLTEAGRFSRLQMDFTAGETTLFSLCSSAYIPATGGVSDA